MKVTGTYLRVWIEIFQITETFHLLQKPNPSSSPQLWHRNGAMDQAATAASAKPVISCLLFPKSWDNFLKHLLRWCKAAFTLRLKQMTPCRWKETWQRPLLFSTSQRQKRPQGTQQNEKLLFFFPPYHWCLLICPVHREHPLMFCFHVSALLHGYRKRILQIDLSSLPLLGMNSYYISSFGLSSPALFASI